jgi:transcriptional regulator with XRE-family HTH domain
MEGENLRRLAGLHAITLSQLADLLGVKKQSVNEWVTGRKRLSRDHLRVAADLFGITMNELEGDLQPCLEAAVASFAEAEENIRTLGPTALRARVRPSKPRGVAAMTRLPEGGGDDEPTPIPDQQATPKRSAVSGTGST